MVQICAAWAVGKWEREIDRERERERERERKKLNETGARSITC